jgi:dTDP-4-dehydrorhamnose reductase
MRTAVVGAGGQLGADLVDRLGPRACPLGHADLELTDPPSVAAALDRCTPQAVINCAAYNLVDQAEADPETAFAVNALGARTLAQECRRRDLPLLHVSTDYVFGLDAPHRPLREDDPPGPLNVYGTSKLAGEMFVRAEAPRHYIVRTCGLYGRPSPTGKGNFVHTILRLAAEREELRVVHDQRCTPTSTADLADALLALLDSRAWGTYHATNAGDCTWYEFACEIIALRGLRTRVVPVASAEFPRPARRPAYSVLDGARLTRVLGRPLRPWRAALADYLAALPE